MKVCSASLVALIWLLLIGCLGMSPCRGQYLEVADGGQFDPPPDGFAAYGDTDADREPGCDIPEGEYATDSEWGTGSLWHGGLPALILPGTFIDLRHSSSDGRYIGKGQPLQGTSWLNRPYEVGFETGAFLMAGRVASHVRANNDLMGAIHLGWDWDHYWGTQARVTWSTPSIGSGTMADPPDSSNMFIYDLSLMYYPWGDSKVRPYYRLGLGLTDFEYVNDQDLDQDASLFTIPFGFGIKYQSQRWMAWRAELVDNLAFGQNGTRTLNNFTLSFGAEWRFGGKPAPRWYSPSANQVW